MTESILLGLATLASYYPVYLFNDNDRNKGKDHDEKHISHHGKRHQYIPPSESAQVIDLFDYDPREYDDLYPEPDKPPTEDEIISTLNKDILHNTVNTLNDIIYTLRIFDNTINTLLLSNLSIDTISNINSAILLINENTKSIYYTTCIKLINTIRALIDNELQFIVNILDVLLMIISSVPADALPESSIYEVFSNNIYKKISYFDSITTLNILINVKDANYKTYNLLDKYKYIKSSYTESLLFVIKQCYTNFIEYVNNFVNTPKVVSLLNRIPTTVTCGRLVNFIELNSIEYNIEDKLEYISSHLVHFSIPTSPEFIYSTAEHKKYVTQYLSTIGDKSLKNTKMFNYYTAKSNTDEIEMVDIHINTFLASDKIFYDEVLTTSIITDKFLYPEDKDNIVTYINVYNKYTNPAMCNLVIQGAVDLLHGILKKISKLQTIFYEQLQSTIDNNILSNDMQKNNPIDNVNNLRKFETAFKVLKRYTYLYNDNNILIEFVNTKDGKRYDNSIVFENLMNLLLSSNLYKNIKNYYINWLIKSFICSTSIVGAISDVMQSHDTSFSDIKILTDFVHSPPIVSSFSEHFKSHLDPILSVPAVVEPPPPSDPPPPFEPPVVVSTPPPVVVSTPPPVVVSTPPPVLTDVSAMPYTTISDILYASHWITEDYSYSLTDNHKNRLKDIKKILEAFCKSRENSNDVINVILHDATTISITNILAEGSPKELATKIMHYIDQIIKNDDALIAPIPELVEIYVNIKTVYDNIMINDAVFLQKEEIQMLQSYMDKFSNYHYISECKKERYYETVLTKYKLTNIITTTNIFSFIKDVLFFGQHQPLEMNSMRLNNLINMYRYGLMQIYINQLELTTNVISDAEINRLKSIGDIIYTKALPLKNTTHDYIYYSVINKDGIDIDKIEFSIDIDDIEYLPVIDLFKLVAQINYLYKIYNEIEGFIWDPVSYNYYSENNTPEGNLIYYNTIEYPLTVLYSTASSVCKCKFPGCVACSNDKCKKTCVKDVCTYTCESHKYINEQICLNDNVCLQDYCSTNNNYKQCTILGKKNYYKRLLKYLNFINQKATDYKLTSFTNTSKIIHLPSYISAVCSNLLDDQTYVINPVYILELPGLVNFFKQIPPLDKMEINNLNMELFKLFKNLTSVTKRSKEFRLILNRISRINRIIMFNNEMTSVIDDISWDFLLDSI